MRLLNRNKQTFWYATYTGATQLTDTEGNYTGENYLTYDVPVSAKAYISAATGEASVKEFGVDTQYSHVIFMANKDPQTSHINEQTIIWIDTATPHILHPTHKVVRVSKSLNHTLIALQEVKW